MRKCTVYFLSGNAILNGDPPLAKCRGVGIFRPGRYHGGGGPKPTGGDRLADRADATVGSFMPGRGIRPFETTPPHGRRGAIWQTTSSLWLLCAHWWWEFARSRRIYRSGFSMLRFYIIFETTYCNYFVSFRTIYFPPPTPPPSNVADVHVRPRKLTEARGSNISPIPPMFLAFRPIFLGFSSLFPIPIFRLPSPHVADVRGRPRKLTEADGSNISPIPP